MYLASLHASLTSTSRELSDIFSVLRMNVMRLRIMSLAVRTLVLCILLNLGIRPACAQSPEQALQTLLELIRSGMSDRAFEESSSVLKAALAISADLWSKHATVLGNLTRAETDFRTAQS